MIHQQTTEKKEQRGKLIFFVTGPDSQGIYFWPDILGSKKSSQMVVFVSKSQNVESSLNHNNLLSHKGPISMFDIVMFI